MSDTNTGTAIDVGGWFSDRGLPFTSDMATILDDVWGLKNVEELKLFKLKEFLELFEHEKKIIRRKAEKVWEELGRDNAFNSKKSARKRNHLNQAQSQKKSKPNSNSTHAIRDNNVVISVLHPTFIKEGQKGFTRVVTETKEEKEIKKQERKRREQQEKEEAAAARQEATSVDSDTSADDDSSDDGMSLASLDGLGEKQAAKPAAVLALPPSNFRVGRCQLSQDLLDVACSDEKKIWAADKLLPKDTSCEDVENLEDHRGMYRRLGPNLSKTSSQDEVNKAISTITKEWRTSALRTHSDKTSDPKKHDEFLDAKAAYESKKGAFFLGDKDENGGYARRVYYDKVGEEFREQFKDEFDENYPDYSFAKRALEIDDTKRRQEIYLKAQKTRVTNQDTSGLEKIDIHWDKKKGQQNMHLKLHVWNLLTGAKGGKQYTVSEIARYIRKVLYKSDKKKWTGIAKGDDRFASIRGVINRIKVGGGKGHYDNAKPSNSKTAKSGARGRKVSAPVRKVSASCLALFLLVNLPSHIPLTNRCVQIQMEKKLIEWCDKQWGKNKVVTRGIIFRRALEFLPNFCGGKTSKKCFRRMKEWFYNGFNKRCKLSKRRISSTGQKLPKDWEKKVASIIARVAKAQMPRQRGDGSFHGGVSDAKMGNTVGSKGVERTAKSAVLLALRVKRRIGSLYNSLCSKMVVR